MSKESNGKINFNLGVYDRGQSAAESLSLARYLMYQALYWHRTSRAVRVMIHEALKSLIAARFETGKDRYSEFFKSLDNAIGYNDMPAKIGINEMLDIIEIGAGEDGKNLIQMIKQRKYYKRIITIHENSSEFDESGKKSFLQQFRDQHDRAGFQETLQEKFRIALIDFLDLTDKDSKMSLLTPQRTQMVIDMLGKKGTILCDAPSPSYGTDDQRLSIMPEPERLHKNYFSRVDAGIRVSEVWNQVYFKLMNIAAKGRVFCHPDVRDTIMAALGINQVMNLVKNALNEYH